jgi:hypothetical protein
MFRRIAVLGVLLAVLSSGFIHAQTLDDAIKNATGEMSQRLMTPIRSL